MMSQLQKLFQRIDKSKIFQSFVIAVIVVSALTVGAHTYSLHPTVEFILNWMDVGITAFFLIELIIRFIASKGIKDFFSKGWNIFDTIIVLGSLYPAAGSTMLLARLLRIFRVLRLVSMIPELRLLVNSLLKAIPQMGYIALLMFVIFYIYAAMGSMMFADINPVLWQDVSISMLTLFRIATFEDWTDIMYETMAVYELSWIYYLTFIFLTAFVFLNMMVGAILEVMSEEHRNARELKADNNSLPATQGQVVELQAQIAELKTLLSKTSDITNSNK
ncbi:MULTISPECIES: ion transporter [Pseudoalteromonas]|jgi:voltage-gated sodium channel|uniref:Cation transporter n=1 Tax=Pseudoalteromonas agarivorans TaxID=176102 RepID=A0ABR5VMA3_9GAMM|nr:MULTISPECIES: ion transporter [Pseudoalteromonas]MAJ40679.1 ion transporter [Pseudoalteromonadaceae bacterium]MCP4056627.1 ion transporter [Pseudoalteromonas sp.]MDC9522494.1 ion transporter [Pseudoalteromonas sp. Angola-31]MDY6887632.1 ion transporter [Pseudomonadota bacterium]OUX86306.1 MAG: ion transporter [Pseudoalteromonas sp. TMED43]|tara:strand:- start:17866 stop:18693 length:828 start_codon:yes stop_codon:yes gene_type:complete